ncbi:MAG: 50S ribosomal protein L9 [Gammaproteobacteria bacterium]|jgi:large subunit ribosomal protein L9
MDVILLEKIENLGDIGDQVKVRPGYGRNFLLPQGKAALATAENVAKLEARRAELESKAADELTAAQQRAKQFEGFALTIPAKAGTEGKLFGSIGTADIAEACENAGIPVEKREVRMADGPIRIAGEHEVELHLHSDVAVVIPVTVVAEE